MSNQRANYRADVVGSFLRPAELKEARARYAAGEIPAAELRAVEDRHIAELVKKQKAHGLHFITDGKNVVLGLITTKSPVLEDADAVIARIREAAKYVPLDRLSLSPQCGFASCEIGNKLTEEEQWAKVDLVQEIARRVWG